MRCASLALPRDMLRVGCNSSEISSMSTIEWTGWLKWEGTAAVAFVTNRWNRSHLSADLSRIFSKFLTFTLHTFVLTQMCRSPSPMLSWAYFGALKWLQTQINIGEGKITQVFQDLWRGLQPCIQFCFILHIYSVLKLKVAGKSQLLFSQVTSMLTLIPIDYGDTSSQNVDISIKVFIFVATTRRSSRHYAVTL